MLPFNLIHFTGLFLYPQKTSENAWLSEVFSWIRGQWHEMNMTDNIFTRETILDV